MLGSMRGETLSMTDLEDRLPGCLGKLAAIENYTSGRPWLACRHVVDGAAGMICVGHPAAGVLCTGCIPHHIRRHVSEVEFTCDECATVVDEINGLAVECSAARLVVRDTKGRRRPMVGRVWIIGMGVCSPCWRASAELASA